MQTQIIIAILVVLMLLTFLLLIHIAKSKKKVQDDIQMPDNIITEDMLPIRSEKQHFYKKKSIINPDMIMQNIFTAIADIIINENNIDLYQISDEPNKDTYYEDMQKNNHYNDSQNVHENYIIKCLSNKIKRLFELNAFSLDILNAGISYEEIMNAMYQESITNVYTSAKIYCSNDVDKFNKINRVLDEISKNNSVISYSFTHEGNNILLKENWLFAQIWKRINSIDNIMHKNDLEIAFLDQLTDCISSDFINTVVCINGRVSRVMDSFTLLDADSILSSPIRDKKEIENEAYMKASNILQNELDIYKMNLPESSNTIKQLYNTPEDELTKRELLIVKNFESIVKEKISDELNNDYNNILVKNDLDILINKAQAGV